MRETYFFLFLAGIYSATIGLGSWYVMGSDKRRQWQTRVLEARIALGVWLNKQRTCAVHKSGKALPALQAWAGFAKRHILQNRRVVSFTVVMLAAPALIAQLLAPSNALDGYDDTPQPSAPVITALLKGEQLVPPPPLPPEVFLAKEVEAERHELASASREWNVLDADFRQRLLTLYSLMAKQGYQMALLEGYRSAERQAYLAKLGPHVTNAGAYQSYHQYGLAADSAFYRNGKLVISERDPWAMEGYRLYGRYAESVGLVWGGRWQMMDFGHVELRKPKVLARH